MYPPPPSIADIKAAVCARYELPPMAMIAQRRSRSIARPRQVAMFLATELTPCSLPTIGRHFGGRDHTTVMHAVRRIKELRRGDMCLDADVRAVELELRRQQAARVALGLAIVGCEADKSTKSQRQGLAQHEGA